MKGKNSAKYQRFLTIMCNVRFEFPEFAKEIDRLTYDAGKKFEPNEVSFEEFHRMRNEMFGLTASLAVVEFPEKN